MWIHMIHMITGWWGIPHRGESCLPWIAAMDHTGDPPTTIDTSTRGVPLLPWWTSATKSTAIGPPGSEASWGTGNETTTWRTRWGNRGLHQWTTVAATVRRCEKCAKCPTPETWGTMIGTGTIPHHTEDRLWCTGTSYEHPYKRFTSWTLGAQCSSTTAGGNISDDCWNKTSCCLPRLTWKIKDSRKSSNQATLLVIFFFSFEQTQVTCGRSSFSMILCQVHVFNLVELLIFLKASLCYYTFMGFFRFFSRKNFYTWLVTLPDLILSHDFSIPPASEKSKKLKKVWKKSSWKN